MTVVVAHADWFVLFLPPQATNTSFGTKGKKFTPSLDERPNRARAKVPFGFVASRVFSCVPSLVETSPPVGLP